MSSKAEIIGEALLKVGGGVLTPDLSVRWGEAETYLAYAVNYVQLGNYWAESKAEGERTINPLLLTVFDNIALVKDTNRNQFYSDLPKNVITIPKGRALEIMTIDGHKCFPLAQGDDALEEYYGQHKKYMSYQVEGAKRVWWYNVKFVKLVRAKYLVHVGDLDDDDEIILPSDGAVKVIEIMVEFLTGQRKADKDYKEDGKDNQ